ncbi:MAG: phosphotransferase [Pseudomonadales bacterium]|nr:phosphotransferase [Pseudomonadales bacterium]
MPIDEGVNVDLQFLIVEVKKQARATLSQTDRPSASKVNKIKEREDYIDNLKNTLENKSYYQIHRLEDADRQMNYFKALITIASNLERVSDIFENISDQMEYVSDVEYLKEFALRRYYQVIYRALDMIYPALTQHDLEMAQAICDCEQTIDDLYDESFLAVRRNLRQRRKVDDTLTLLFIVRYLERIGDAFLNIGEAILNIHLGEKMGIRQFRNLRKALEMQGIDISKRDVEFRSIMNTRSGSRVAKILSETEADGRKAVFYKEGIKEKIDEEAEGLRLWGRVSAVKVPRVLWHDSRRKHATLLLEYIEGNDLLEILINQRPRVAASLELLATSLRQVWEETRRNKSVKSNHISQLVSRTDDIVSVHSQLFTLEADMDAMLKEARKLESGLKSPFSVLIHGDFNVDNIIYKPDEEQVYFVDVHRSGYGDYVQDISVFLVSNFRIPIFSPDIRQRLNEANLRIFECAREYAEANKDATFEARLALGLFRSLITSTRFLFDEGFSTDMFMRGTRVLKDLLESRDDLAKFALSEDYFLYR